MAFRRWLGLERGPYRPLEEAEVELEAPPPVPPPPPAPEPAVPGLLEREAPSRGVRRGRRLLRLLNVQDPAVLFYGSCLANVPQVVICACVFGSAWRADAGVCDKEARAQWRVWGAAHAARLLLTTAVAGARWRVAVSV